MIEKLTKLQNEKWEKMKLLKDKEKFIYQLHYNELLKDVLAIERVFYILKAENNTGS